MFDTNEFITDFGVCVFSVITSPVCLFLDGSLRRRATRDGDYLSTARNSVLTCPRY